MSKLAKTHTKANHKWLILPHTQIKRAFLIHLGSIWSMDTDNGEVKIRSSYETSLFCYQEHAEV